MKDNTDDFYKDFIRGNRIKLLYDLTEECNFSEIKKIVETAIAEGIDVFKNYEDFNILLNATAQFGFKDLDYKKKIIEIIKYLFEKNPESVNYQDGTGCNAFAELVKNVANSNVLDSDTTKDVVNLLKLFISNGAEFVNPKWMHPLGYYIQKIGYEKLENIFESTYTSSISGGGQDIGGDFDS